MYKKEPTLKKKKLCKPPNETKIKLIQIQKIKDSLIMIIYQPISKLPIPI